MLKRNFVFAVLSLSPGCATAPPSFAQQTEPAVGTLDDAGRIDKATAERVFPAKPIYSPYAGRRFQPARFSVTRICIRQLRSTPVRSAQGSEPAMLIGSPAAKK